MRLRLSLLLCLLGTAPAQAAELEYGDARFELRSSLKSLYTNTRTVMTDDLVDQLNDTLADPTDTGTPRRDRVWGLLTRLRLTGEAVWQDRVYAQVVYDNELRNGSVLDSLGFQISQEIGTQTWLDWDRTYHDGGNNWRHLVYRAWIRWQEEDFDVTVGRQRIALGRGRLWNPEDLFNPIFPLAIEAGERIGQDAAVARVRLLEGLWASAIVSPQDRQRDWRTAARLDYEHVALDAGVMFGDFEGDLVWGADFATNLGDAALRGEITYTSIRGRSNPIQAVASLDYNVDFGRGLYVLLEYLYNENTIDELEVDPFEVPIDPAAPPLTFDPEPLVRALALGQRPLVDRITTVRKNQLGFQASYELTALLQGGFLVLYDWDGRSAAFVPSLTWSLADDVVLSVSGQLFVGKDDGRNDYGDVPGLLIVSIEAWF